MGELGVDVVQGLVRVDCAGRGHEKGRYRKGKRWGSLGVEKSARGAEGRGRGAPEPAGVGSGRGIAAGNAARILAGAGWARRIRRGFWRD